jgi:hypothetical protein
MNNRDHAMEMYHHLYTTPPPNHSPRGYIECVYCGEPANCKDHVPPISKVDDYRTLHLTNEMYLTLHSCRECNGIASDTLNVTPFDRQTYIHDALRKRYRRHLEQPEWSDRELEGMSTEFKRFIKAGMNFSDLMWERLDYGVGMRNLLDYLEPTEQPA